MWIGSELTFFLPLYWSNTLQASQDEVVDEPSKVLE